MAQAQFPEPKDLELTFAQKVGTGETHYPAGSYNVSNPHPGFGKDPNIINEFGHTHYPKWVKNKEGVAVVVNSSDEEAEIVGKPVKEDKPEAWDK